MLPPGAVDLHVHCGPDTRPRKLNALELMWRAQEAGMSAVLLKNHDTPTVAIGALLRAMDPVVQVHGGLVLNDAVGGFNIAAVENALRLGGRQIWMPTHCSAHDRQARGLPGGLSIYNEKGAIRREIYEICRLIGEHRAILGTGHLSAQEIRVLVGVALDCEVKRILVNHPEFERLNFSQVFQREIACEEVRFERCYVRPDFALNWDQLAERTRAIGVEYTILATDLGQEQNVDPVTGFEEMAEQFAQRGFSTAELNLMMRDQPKEWLEA